MTIDSRGLVISLSAAKFFPSGEDQITPSQLPVLDAVVKTMASLPNPFRSMAITDSVPIVTARFHDNWDLSAARASSVLRYTPRALLDYSGPVCDRGLWSLSPVGDNSTEDGRARNRQRRDHREPELSEAAQ